MIDEDAFNDLVGSQMIMCCVFSNHGMLLCTQTPNTHSTCAASLPAVLVIVQCLVASYMKKAATYPDRYITSALQGRVTSL